MKFVLILASLFSHLQNKKRKKVLVDCMLLGIYFFLSINAPTIAIAMIMATTPIARYMSMSELETNDDAVEVGAGELVAVDAMLTVAAVSPYELKYELLPAKVA